MLCGKNPPSIHARVSYSWVGSQASVRYGVTLEDFLHQMSKDLGRRGYFSL